MLQSIILQAQPGGSTMMSNIILFGGIAIIFYFFMIRPQQKKSKDQKNFIKEIKRGDNIVTIGGIHGKVAAIDDDTVTLDLEKGARIKFERSAISLEASKKQADKSKT